MNQLKHVTVISLALVVVALALAGPAFAGPKLVIDQSVIVYTEPIMEGTKITGEFIIQNQGDADLEIKKVVPG